VAQTAAFGSVIMPSGSVPAGIIYDPAVMQTLNQTGNSGGRLGFLVGNPIGGRPGP